MNVFLQRRPIPASDASEVRLVICEEGAACRSDDLAAASSPADTDVLVQSAGEPDANFEQRALRRLSAIATSARHVRSATFVLNSSAGEAAFLVRRTLGRAVIRQLVAGRACELVFRAAAQMNGHQRRELFELVEELVAELPGTNVSMRVRFDDDSPRSSAAMISRDGSSGLLGSAVGLPFVPGDSTAVTALG